MNSLLISILVIIIFTALTIIWTYPLVFKLESSIFADGNWLFDTLAAIYGTWTRKMVSLGEMQANFNNLVGYPFGMDVSMENKEPVIEIPLLFLSLWKNEIFAFNILILSSFILSGLGMFYLAMYFTKNRMASFLSAIIYAFCPYHTLHAFSHVSLAVIQWLPLYILALFWFAEKFSYTRAVLCALVFLLLALSNYYYGYIMFIFTIVYVLFQLYRWCRYRAFGLFSFVKKIFLMGIIIFIALIPLNYKAILAVMGCRNKSPATTEAEVPRFAPPFSDLIKYSARITDYIRPSEYHPVFGKTDFFFIKPYVDSDRHWAERTVFLGYVPLFLFLYYLKIFLKKKQKLAAESVMLISFFTALLISLQPKLGFLYMPNFFLYKLFPMFRSYARFGILVILGVSVFAGLGLKEMLAGVRRKVLFPFLIIGLVLFEFTVIPPARNVDLSGIPDVYQWVKKLPPGTAIAEYPLFSEIEEGHFKYLVYQRFHKRPLLNGSHKGTLGDAIRRELMDLASGRSVNILDALGIEYAILHKEKYSSEEMDIIDKNAGLKKILDYKDSAIYEITPVVKRPEIIYWRNFYDEEIWSDGNSWRWADNGSMCWLSNPFGVSHEVSIVFKVLSFAMEREMRIYLNNKLHHTINIRSPHDTSKAEEVNLNLLLEPGSNNIIKFSSPQGSSVIDSVLHNGDTRSVCFAFGDIKVNLYNKNE